MMERAARVWWSWWVLAACGGAESAPSVDSDTDAEGDVLTGDGSDAHDSEDIVTPRPCPVEAGLVHREDAPLGLAVDGDMLYWTSVRSEGGRLLRRLGVEGTEVETVHERSTGMVTVTVVDGVAYYGDRDRGSLWAWDSDLGERSLATGLVELDSGAVAVSDGYLYALTHGEGPAGFTHQLVRVPLDGGPVEPLDEVVVGMADGDPSPGMRVGRDGIYWSSVTGYLFRFGASSRIEVVLDIPEGIRAWDLETTEAGDAIWFVRWSDLTDIEVLRPGTSTPERLYSGAGARMAVHAHEGVVYWPRLDGIVGLIPEAGASPQLVAEVDAGSVTSIVHVDGFLFWANTAMEGFGGGIGQSCIGRPATRFALEIESTQPLRVGTQTVVFDLGAEVAPAVLTVRVWMPAHGHGNDATDVTALGAGRFEAEVTFGMPGTWELIVEVDGARTTAPLTVVP